MNSLPPFLRYEINDEGIVLVELVGFVSTAQDVALLERAFVTLYDACPPPIDVVIGMSQFTLRADVARDVNAIRTRLLTTRVRHTARYAVPRVMQTLMHTTAALTKVDENIFSDREQALASVRTRRRPSLP